MRVKGADGRFVTDTWWHRVQQSVRNFINNLREKAHG